MFRRMLLIGLLLITATADASLFHRSGSAGADLLSLQRVPFLGWTDWGGCGNPCSEAQHHTQSDALVSTGLTAAGYTIFQMDESWSSGSRDGGGHLISNFPAGAAAMASYIKANGQIPVLYTDSGPSGCGVNAASGPPGPTGHYLLDFTDFFVNWGYQGVKVDFCGNAGILDPKGVYGYGACVTNPSTAAPGDGCIQDGTGVRSVLNQVGVRLYYYGCADSSGGTRGQWEYNPYVCGFMRGAGDLVNNAGCSTPNSSQWSSSVSNFQNATVAHSGIVMPYHFSDPDSIPIGYTGLTTEENRSLWALWAIGGSPVIINCLVTSLGSAELTLLKNPDYTAIVQDAWVRGGERVTAGGTAITYVKRLSTAGSRAVVLLNYDSATSQTVTVTAANMGLSASAAFSVYDVASQTSLGSFTGSYTSPVLSPHDAKLIRITGGTENPDTCVAVNAGDGGAPISGPTCTYQTDFNGYNVDQSDAQANATAHAIDRTGVTNPAPEAVYQKWRGCTVAYDQTIGQCPIEYRASNLEAGRNYLVRLHYAENEKTAAGQRQFVVRMNTCDGSQLVETNYDIYAHAGAQYKAVVAEYVVNARCGMISVDFSSGAAYFPAIAGVEWIAQ